MSENMSPSSGVRKSDYHDEDKFETVGGSFTLGINGMCTIDARIPDDPGINSVQLQAFSDDQKITFNLSLDAARRLSMGIRDLVNKLAEPTGDQVVEVLIHVHQTCVEVSALFADKELSRSAVSMVLERLGAECCMQHSDPELAAAALSHNIMAFVDINLMKRHKAVNDNNV